LQPPFAQNGTVVNLRMSTRFCTKGDGFQFLAKFAILPQNANSQKQLKVETGFRLYMISFLRIFARIVPEKILKLAYKIDRGVKE
ncbi:hypothetical protein ACRCLU_26520, partial [Klebsiella pneumoniae]|uniref:hypothetical protein n=1 Tax=Klebsiella pneumoniae TaxID=573 RepID=UPI003D995D4C